MTNSLKIDGENFHPFQPNRQSLQPNIATRRLTAPNDLASFESELLLSCLHTEAP